MILNRLGLRKDHIGQYFRKKVPGPHTLGEKIGMLANPAQARLLGQRLFEQGARVYINPGSASLKLRLDFFLHLSQTRRDGIVVILV